VPAVDRMCTKCSFIWLRSVTFAYVTLTWWLDIRLWPRYSEANTCANTYAPK